ncbi:hypothetical protein ACTQ5A_10415, partial [Bacillota bacterium LCP21S3_F9]
HYEGRSSEHQVGKGWPLAPHCGRSAPQKGPLGFAICSFCDATKVSARNILMWNICGVILTYHRNVNVIHKSSFRDKRYRISIIK